MTTKNLSSKTLRNPLASPQKRPTYLRQLLFLFVAILLTGLLLKWFLPQTAPQAAESPRLSLNLSGAMSERFVLSGTALNDSATCTPNGIAFNVPASGGLGYGLAFHSAQALPLDRAVLYTLGGGQAPLELSLFDSAGSYHTFIATAGEINFDAGLKSGTMVAQLFDEQSRPLYLDASWSCA